MGPGRAPNRAQIGAQIGVLEPLFGPYPEPVLAGFDLALKGLLTNALPGEGPGTPYLGPYLEPLLSQSRAGPAPV